MTLSDSSQRVQSALQEKGFTLEVVELPASTRTAVEAAAAVGCEVGQIVKSLIFRGRSSGRAILVEASGANRVSEARLAERAGEAVEKADAAFVREKSGFSIGGVPPIGHASPMLTLIDADLMGYERIWAAAGTPHSVFALRPQDLVRMTGGEVVVLKEG